MLGCSSGWKTSATQASACAASFQKTRQPDSPPEAPAPVISRSGAAVGDAGDEVGRVELRRIDEDRDRRAGPAAAEHPQHLTPEPRPRSARLAAHAGKVDWRRQRMSTEHEDEAIAVAFSDLFGTGQDARRRTAEDDRVRDGAANGREHAAVLVVVVPRPREHHGDLDRAAPGRGEGAMRRQPSRRESVQNHGHTHAGGVVRAPFLPWGSAILQAVPKNDSGAKRFRRGSAKFESRAEAPEAS